jgi:hypothetical protein
MSDAVAKRARSIGGSIGLFFGGLWCLIGALALPPAGQIPAAMTGFAISAVLIIRLWRAPAIASAGAIMFGRKAYMIAVALEVVAIVMAANLLPHYGLAAYFIPVLGIIVGLHFIGLWVATRMSRAATPLLWIAGGMVAVSALSAFLPHAWDGFNPRDAACGFANALVLWFGASRPPK